MRRRSFYWSMAGPVLPALGRPVDGWKEKRAVEMSN